jgi:hypothetical protein
MLTTVLLTIWFLVPATMAAQRTAAARLAALTAAGEVALLVEGDSAPMVFTQAERMRRRGIAVRPATAPCAETGSIGFLRYCP